jgi:CheY-specific phosphatase CheX
VNQASQAALNQALAEVFESLCFMVPRHASEAAVEPPLPEPCVVVLLDFSGAGHGTLCLSLSESLIAPVTSAMLGDDGEPSLDEQHLATCELANILCGNLLPRLAGQRAVFNLGTPRVVAWLDVAYFADDEAVARVLLDDGVASGSVVLELGPEAA